MDSGMKFRPNTWKANMFVFPLLWTFNFFVFIQKKVLGIILQHLHIFFTEILKKMDIRYFDPNSLNYELRLYSIRSYLLKSQPATKAKWNSTFLNSSKMARSPLYLLNTLLIIFSYKLYCTIFLILNKPPNFSRSIGEKDKELSYI